MPNWSEYKQAARDRGSLALEMYVAISVPAKPPEELRAVLPDHLAYQGSLEAEGKLAFAGPLSDLSGDLMEGEGLIVYRATSLEEARSLADADPMHRTGTRSYTIRRWLVNEGSLSLNIGLSAQKIRLN